MVRGTNYLNRFAFTMIELIFAIVIIGITIISLPMMTQVTARGIENSILQEAVFAASSELMGATSGYWDENSMEDIETSHLSRVINISGDCNTNQLRPGHIAQPFHRRCLDLNTTGAHDSETPVGALDVFDLNDAAHSGQDIFVNDTTDASGYKETYTSIVDVNRTGDVKEITVTVSKEDGTTVTILRAQSANIGEIDYYKRRLF